MDLWRSDSNRRGIRVSKSLTAIFEKPGWRLIRGFTVSKNVQLLANVRFVNGNTIRETFLFCKTLVNN